VDLSYGAGLLKGSSTFQVGFGVRTKGEPDSSFTAKAVAPSGAESATDPARYYVHTSSLAAAYHFLEGDSENATKASARAVSALVGGVKLGPRSAIPDKIGAWGADARSLLAIDAQLAAEAGMPMLAGDLFTVLRSSLPEDADDATIADVLSTPPFGLAGIANTKPILDRAARALRIVSAPLACTEAKEEIGGFEEPDCKTYPLALALRAADVIPKLPRLSPRDHSCPAMRSLDALLGGLEKGSYDPDAFTKAITDLRAADRAYEAAVLLTRQRRDAHCNTSIIDAARALGRSALLPPDLRADLLTISVNCTAQTISKDVLDDLRTIDAATRNGADPSRSFKLLLFMIDLGRRLDRWDVPALLLEDPQFHDRWLKVNPTVATIALIFDYAVSLATNQPLSARAENAYQLLCETFPPADRVSLCSTAEGLRKRKGTPADQSALAKEAMQKIFDYATSAPPAAKP
jgi:hypothetical protein